RPPVDVIEARDGDLDGHRLTYVLQRGRTDPAEPVRVDEEPGMHRLLDLPGERELTVVGEARISAAAPDPMIDRLLGLPGAPAGGITARSSDRLDGDLAARASSAIDGDPSTAWTTPFNGARGQWVEYQLPAPVRIDHLDLQVLADGRHSL